MAYASIAEVKAYLGITVSTDDTLIEALIDRAKGIIESYTGRVFESETATKYFDTDNIEGRWLYLWGYDLLTVTTLTNGDGVEIASANYRLEPRNETPKWAIRLDEDYTWEFDDSDDEISVAGTWGYATTAPYDIEHATVRLTAFLYRQKDTSADIDRPFVTGDGVTIMPSNLPADVKSILDKYKRRVG
jgi:hypothetical protein